MKDGFTLVQSAEVQTLWLLLLKRKGRFNIQRQGLCRIVQNKTAGETDKVLT